MQQPDPAQECTLPPEPSSISSGEILMRRVPDQPQYFKNGKLMQGVFLPNKYPRDEDGLSFSRRNTPEQPSFLTPDQFKQNCSDEKMRRTAGGLLVLVDDVLGITSLPIDMTPSSADPAKGLIADPGHVVVREINSKRYGNGPEATDESRQRIREMAAELVYRYSDVKRFAIVPG